MSTFRCNCQPVHGCCEQTPAETGVVSKCPTKVRKTGHRNNSTDNETYAAISENNKAELYILISEMDAIGQVATCVSKNSSNHVSAFPKYARVGCPDFKDRRDAAGIRRASIVQFRKDLRVAGNEALVTVSRDSVSVAPVYYFNSRYYGKSSLSFDQKGPHCTGLTSERRSLPKICNLRPLVFQSTLFTSAPKSAIRRVTVFCVSGHVGIEEIGVPSTQVPDPLPEERKRTVAVFWDLDNKPPKAVPPYDAALRLRDLASEFGLLVDMVAYANRHAFIYVPQWIREERQERKRLDVLERKGLVKVEEPYRCKFCGRMCKTNIALKKHFKQLHERERNKRLTRLNHLKGRKREKYKEKLADKEHKYNEVAQQILVPKIGYGLATELKRAGVYVRTVEDRPQAADEALMKHITLYIHRGLETLCLVSDDSDFTNILRLARMEGVQTIVVGDTMTLSRHADISFSWEEVASGRARWEAAEARKEWTNKAELVHELEDDSDLDESKNSEFLALRPNANISAFSEEEAMEGAESDSEAEDRDIYEEATWNDVESDDEDESVFENFDQWGGHLQEKSESVF